MYCWGLLKKKKLYRFYTYIHTYISETANKQIWNYLSIVHVFNIRHFVQFIHSLLLFTNNSPYIQTHPSRIVVGGTKDRQKRPRANTGLKWGWKVVRYNGWQSCPDKKWQPALVLDIRPQSAALSTRTPFTSLRNVCIDSSSSLTAHFNNTGHLLFLSMENLMGGYGDRCCCLVKLAQHECNLEASVLLVVSQKLHSMTFTGLRQLKI